MEPDVLADLLQVNYHPTAGNPFQKLDFWKRRSKAGETYPVLVYFGDTPQHVLEDPTTIAEASTLRPEDGIPYYAMAAGFNVCWPDYQVRDAAATPWGGIFQAADADNPEQDAARIVQYLRQNAATLQIDPDRIYGYGVGAGATLLLRVLLGPDFADAGSAVPEEKLSSRLAGGVLVDPIASWTALDQTILGDHFLVPVGSPLSVADPGEKAAASATTYLVPGENAATPVYLAATVPNVSSAFTAPFPSDSEPLGSYWHARALYELLIADDLTYHTVSSKLVDNSGSDPMSPGDLVDDAIDWLIAEAGLLPAEERVVRLVEAKIAEITPENGYLTDVRRVYRFGDPDGSHGIFPAVMVTSLQASYDESSWATREAVAFRVGLTLQQEGWTRHERRTSVFIADVRKAIMTDIQLGGLVDKIVPKRSQRYLDRDESGDHSGAAIEIEVGYLEPDTDPYQIAPC